MISVRTKEALAEKKSQGIKLGRPVGSGSSPLDEKKEEIKALLTMGVKKKVIAEKYNITAVGFSKWLKRNNVK